MRPTWLTEELVERRRRARVTLLLAIAERDGGDECHYCARPLCIERPVRTYQPPDDGCCGTCRPLCGVPTRLLPDGLVDATIDHVLPRYHGGPDDIDNLVLACKSCNSQKNTKDYDEYRDWRYA
jgi:hypothetical protein